MSDSDVISTVDPIAQKYGVPTFIWETVAEVESGMNPQAIGDQGTSFGLFQLHRGGQLGNLTEEQAFDPTTNANTAMPSIANAWKQLSKGVGGPQVINGEQYPGNYNWWYDFAVLSGHPGADPQAAAAEAQKLQAEAVALSGKPLGNGATRQPYPGSAASSGDCQAWNPLTYGACIDGYIQTSYIQPVEEAARGWLVKIGIFVLALTLVIVGLWAVSKA